METDLRRYLACMPALREHLTLRVLSELPSLLEQVTPGERQQATKITSV